MDVDFENVSTSILYIENCAQGTTEGDVVNLSPHFVLDADNTTTDLSFPWMQQAEYIRKHSGLSLPERPAGFDGIIMMDAYEELGGISNVTEMWRVIRKAWSLSTNQQTELSERVLEEYAKYGYTGRNRLQDVVYDFCLRLLVPKKVELLRRALDCLKRAAESAPQEIATFRRYYIDELNKYHLARYFEIFSEFFRDYAEYDQTILYIKNVVPVPDGCIATSSGFKSTKMFYGNAFEHYTANLVVLACLNNIAEGRPYDSFKEMSLAQYLTLNKSKRGNPFAHNSELAGFLECIDSALRNASHHGAMRAVKHRRFIEYRSGGTGALREMSYSHYLEKCGQIALSAAALLSLELAIAS